MKGCAAIVTGSSSVVGIGAETAKLIASRGCNVVVNYVTNHDGAEETVAACRAFGVDSFAVKGDVAEDDDCRRMVKEAVDRWGQLDVLVNNAAVTKTVPQADLAGLTAQDFHDIFSVNVVGNFQMTRAAAPHLRASGDASVVNISSIGAFRGNGSCMAYSASKGALNTLTISLARQLAPEVRVNAICPGGLLGNWTRKIMDDEAYQRRVQEAETNFPLRKPVMPTDVAKVALWLIEEAAVMTGEAFRMDAGQHLS
ncbi:MAG: oxidoreductase [Rhodospirillaceae bacterium]|nr:oxidoreductase [Rhodospirillaceae bacterium]